MLLSLKKRLLAQTPSMIRDTAKQDVLLTSANKTPNPLLLGALVLVLVAASVHAFIGRSDSSHSVERALLQIATVERGELLRDIVANGTIVAANAPQLYSPQPGHVKLLVKAGEEVVKGQVVAVVASPTLANELQQQQAELARLKGDLARRELNTRRQTLTLTVQADLAALALVAAKRANRRANISIQDHLISQIDLEQSEDALAKAKLTHQHAMQEVALAKDTLAFELQSARDSLARQKLVVSELQRKLAALSIRASVDGMVGSLLVRDRALVTANDVLMTLVDLSAYEAEIKVAESYANELTLGMTVALKIGNQTVAGELSAVSPEVTDRQVTARVRFEHPQMSGIRQNQQLSARVFLEQKNNVLKVRRGSFTQAGGYVGYRVEGDIARRIDIRIGATSMGEVEILSGVKPGDQLVISHYDLFEQSPSVLLR